MRQLALRGSGRRWLTRLHRWSGLVVTICLLVASLTGTWLVFRAEMDRWMNPRLRVVRPAATRVSQDEIATLVEAAFPDARVSLVSYPDRADESVSVSLSPRQPGIRVLDQIFVNPYTGEILGGRNRGGSLDSLILSLHFTLLLNEWGRWLMGMSALVWLVTNLIGLALSWPALWLRVASWIPILSARMNSGAYKANYDLHRAGGVWLLPILTVLAFTSVELNLPQYIRPLVLVFSTLARPPAGQKVPVDEAVVTFDQADAAVRRVLPEARTNNIFRDLNNGRHSVYFRMPDDANPEGDNFAFVDLRTGGVTAMRLPARSSAGDRFMAWLYPLHTGGAFGWPGRLVVAATGLVMVVLNVTGLYVWWVKWRMRRRARSRRPAVVAA